MTFQDIINEVKSSKWQPEFEWVDSIDECADRINSPHEDYPLGIQPTIQMIGLLKNEKRITWADACNIQSFLFRGKADIINAQIASYTGGYSKNHEWLLSLPNRYITIGLRKKEVQIGAWIPPHPIFLQDLVDKIFPIFLTDTPFFHERQKQISSNIELIEWYKLFETIHPFEDLNGRVGGIIVAILSHTNGQFLAPKRFKP